MARSNISADMLHLSLKQLGGKVRTASSKVTVVKFEINPTLTVSYFLHIRDEEKIYLQRIEPYPVRNYKFETVDNIVQFIKKDVEQFENASKSSNFELFLEVINTNFEVRKELEALFLLHNVPHLSMEEILKAEKETLSRIASAEHTALKNNPGTFPGENADLGDIYEMDQDISEATDAKMLYGESKQQHHGPIYDIVKDALKEVMDESKEDLKKEIIAELRK